MSDHDETYSPPAWGFFAAELFLIQNWNWNSTELSDDVQRRQLVAQFLKTSPVPEASLPALDNDTKQPLHPPSAREIDVILQPWRPSSLRRTAYELVAGGRSEFIILRTDYSNDAHNDTLKQWLEEEEECDPFYEESDEEWRILNDSSMFNFTDSDWLPNLMYLLPELGGCPGYRGSYESQRRRRSLSGSDFDFIWDASDPVSEAQFRAFSFSSTQPLVVADKQGLESDRPLLVYLDGFGNIVRSSRHPAEDLGWEKMFHQQGKSRGHAWADAEVGAAYHEDGEIGKVLYPKVREAAKDGAHMDNLGT